MPIQELRVHGVSGTPPRDILYTDPVTFTPPEQATKIYVPRPQDPSFDTSAFHWANLTSGSTATAFWLVLAPFALANAAGWMAGWRRHPLTALPDPAASHWHERLGRMAIRLAGSGLTGLFLAQVMTAFVLIPYRWTEDAGILELWKIRVDFTGWDPRLVTTVLALLVFLVFYWLVAWVSTGTLFLQVEKVGRHALLLSPSPQPMLDATDSKRPKRDLMEDPGGARIMDERLWSTHPILHRLRRLNFAVGILYIGGTIAAARQLISMDVVLAVITGLSLFTAWSSTYGARSKLVLWITALLPLVAVAALALVMTASARTDWTWSDQVFHQMTFGASMILGLGAFLSIFAGPLAVGAVVLATFIGAMMGTTIGLSLDKWLGGPDILVPSGAGWVAAATFFFVMTLVATALVLAFVGRRAEADGATSPLLRGQLTKMVGRRIELEARWVFYMAALFGIGSFGYAAFRVFAHGADASLGQGVAVWRWWRRLVAGLEPTALGTPPEALVGLAVTFILIPIGFFAFRSIWKGWRGGSRGESRRRQVGILWDLGSFWPRWHHPFSPPGYGPKAVKDLTLLVDSMPEDGVMGAHSQGSLIGAIAITRAEHGVGFLTYGSQLGLLYPRMFPNVGIPNLVEAVATRVGGRWQNLWRRTDPIGGHFVTHDGVRNIEVTEGYGHSGHEITGAYSKARREVSGLGEDPVC